MDELKQDEAPAKKPVKIPRKSLLPPFYQKGGQHFQRRAQNLDKTHRHRWVNKNPRNQHMKVYKGWMPLEDKEKLAKLGLGNLINSANGRATWMDTELWTMPMEVAAAIREELDETLARQSGSQREALDAMADNVRQRTKGAAVPFISSGTTGDVLDRQLVAPPTPAVKK